MLENTYLYTRSMQRSIRNVLENRRQILIIDMSPGAYRIPVSYHNCEELEPLERCSDCYADYIDGLEQFKEDSYREDY